MNHSVPNTVRYGRFGLLPVRSPLLRECPPHLATLGAYVHTERSEVWWFGFFSSAYWDVSLQRVRCPVIRRSCFDLSPKQVSPFGNPRIKGCSTPPRGLSQSRHVLHRPDVPRHPPSACNVKMHYELASNYYSLCTYSIGKVLA